MTREEITAKILAALDGAAKTAPKALIEALKDAGQFIEDSATQPAARNLASASSAEGASTATAAPPTFRLLAIQCAAELDEALALKVGVMDSESKAHAVNTQRMGAMQSVAARLRDA